MIRFGLCGLLDDHDWLDRSSTMNGRFRFIPPRKKKYLETRFKK